MKLKDILNELKQVGLLYYFTNENDYKKIIETNSILPTIEQNPSYFNIPKKK